MSVEFRKALFADERDDNLVEVGKPTRRQDILGHVTGRSPFYDDHLFEGLLHMRCARSPHHHARIRSIDTAEADPGGLTGSLGFFCSDNDPALRAFTNPAMEARYKNFAKGDLSATLSFRAGDDYLRDVPAATAEGTGYTVIGHADALAAVALFLESDASTIRVKVTDGEHTYVFRESLTGFADAMTWLLGQCKEKP